MDPCSRVSDFLGQSTRKKKNKISWILSCLALQKKQDEKEAMQAEVKTVKMEGRMGWGGNVQKKKPESIKKDKRENPVPVCMCACKLLSASGSMKYKEATNTSPLVGTEEERV